MDPRSTQHPCKADSRSGPHDTKPEGTTILTYACIHACPPSEAQSLDHQVRAAAAPGSLAGTRPCSVAKLLVPGSSVWLRQGTERCVIQAEGREVVQGAPELAEVGQQLLQGRLQESEHGIPFFDVGGVAVSGPVPVGVGHLQLFILHRLQPCTAHPTQRTGIDRSDGLQSGCQRPGTAVLRRPGAQSQSTLSTCRLRAA